MKQLILSVLLTIIISSLSIAQDFELVHQFNVGKEFSGKNFPEKADYMYYAPDDFVVDNEDNIYISQIFSKRIFKYDKEFKLIHIIQLSDPAFESIVKTRKNSYRADIIYRVALRCDKYANLYVMIESEGTLLKLLKYDKKGVLLRELPIKKGFASITGFDVNYWNDNILLFTMPSFVQHSDYVFIYNNEGRYLGKTDYYLMERDSFVYLTNYCSNGLQLIKCEYDNKFIPGDKLKETGRIQMDLEYSDNSTNNLPYCPFLGSDTVGNYYFGIDGGNRTTYYYNIGIINPLQNKVSEIKLKETEFTYRGKNVKVNLRKIKISPGGDLYFLGTEVKDLDHFMYNSKEVFINVYKLKCLRK